MRAVRKGACTSRAPVNFVGKEMKNLVVVVAVVSHLGVAHGGTPDWVANNGKSALHPETSFLTGYGIAKIGGDLDHTKYMQLATDVAKRNLVEKVRVTIRTATLSSVEEQDKRYSSYFSSATQSTSDLRLEGLMVETYYDANDGMYFAFAYASRAKLSDLYGAAAARLRSVIADRLIAGKRYEGVNERTKALEEYVACFPLLRELVEARSITAAARYDPVWTPSGVEQDVRMDDSIASQVRQAAQGVIQKPLNTAEDIAWYLVYCLRTQLMPTVRALYVAPFTYHDTGMGSAFSRFFCQALQSKAVEVARWAVLAPDTGARPDLASAAGDFAAASGADYALTGTFWEEPLAVKFIASTRRVVDGRIVASAEAIVPRYVVQSTRLSIKPDNFKNALDDQLNFNRDEIIGGGLSLEIWTNKGVDNLLFSKGERMQVYVRVNMPCYVRLVYHLATQKRALLLENYFIDDSKVNRVYQVPHEFECDAPFGAEVLQAFASNQAFKAVESHRVGDYDILTEDLGGFLTATRGMKKVDPQALQVESRVLVTTIER